MKFELPKLEYKYDALEPFLSANLMHLHHDKHHQTYVDKLNAAIDNIPSAQNRTIDDLISNLNSLPTNAQMAIKNFGGGHYNHSLFWQCMSPNHNQPPPAELLSAIELKYGSFENFVEKFTAAAISLFGSGWVWLQPDLTIITTANQDNPLSDGRPAPILCLDVWEHAYYPDYTYNRADYIKNWFNVVDWDSIARRKTSLPVSKLN